MAHPDRATVRQDHQVPMPKSAIVCCQCHRSARVRRRPVPLDRPDSQAMMAHLEIQDQMATMVHQDLRANQVQPVHRVPQATLALEARPANQACLHRAPERHQDHRVNPVDLDHLVRPDNQAAKAKTATMANRVNRASRVNADHREHQALRVRQANRAAVVHQAVAIIVHLLVSHRAINEHHIVGDEKIITAIKDHRSSATRCRSYYRRQLVSSTVVAHIRNVHVQVALLIK
jgi:hypothetical protein